MWTPLTTMAAPGAAFSTFRSWSGAVIGRPSTVRSLSPAWNPAAAAGEPGTTLATLPGSSLTWLRLMPVTIPNAVIVGQTITDYSRAGDSEGVYTPTSVTIGYDTPWRQVHALLLSAAERTAGVRRDPKPVVLQASLEDYYVKYTLFVCLERQQSRPFTFDTLHAHIQDLFNEYGVQIMSPNYMMDPAAPKVVARTDWYAAPAQPDPPPPVSTAQPL